MSIKLRFAALFAALLAGFQCPAPAHAENETPSIKAVSLPAGAKLRLSGRMDDPHWESAPAHEQFWQYQPTDGAEAPVRTSVKMLVDREAVYLGIRAYDADPAAIRAPLVRRDNVFEDQDYVSVMLDSMGAGKSALVVRVNARGVLADGTYLPDLGDVDFAPEFDVDAKVSRTDDGYIAEIRIPLSALRYTPGSERPWQILVTRSVPREQNLVLTSAPLLQSATSMLEGMNTVEGLGELPSGTGLSIVPGVLLQAGRLDGKQTLRLQPSLDLKWRPSAEWVIDATIKPDFSQVESDVPQLQANSQFALQVEERRPFFQEGSDLLQLPGAMQEQGGNGGLQVYTRSVSAPTWGLRATRRDDDLEGVLLTAYDRGGSYVLLPGAFSTGYAFQPGGTVTLGRARRDYGELTVGAFFANRHYSTRGSGDNTVAAIDLAWRPDASQRMRFMLAGSNTTAQATAIDTLEKGAGQGGHYLLADWINKSERWEPSLSFQQVSSGYRNDTGFVAQSGIRQLTAQLINKNQLEGDWTAVNPFLWMNDTVTTDSGRTVSRELYPGVTLRGPRNINLVLEYHPNLSQRLGETGPLHRYAQYAVNLSMNPAPWFSALSTRLTIGDQLDLENDRVVRGWYLLLDANFHLVDGLELRPRIEQVRLQGPRKQGKALDDTALQLMMIYHFDAVQNLRLIAQRHGTVRVAQSALDVQDYALRDRIASLTFTRRESAKRVTYVGLNYGAHFGDPPDRRSVDLFVKFQWEM